MSKLDELIRELCPDGVEYKKLGEIATISRGGNFQKKDFLTEGVPCIHYGQIYTKYGLFADKTFTFISEECAKKQKMAQPNDIVMAVTSENIEDVCKCLAWLGDEPVAVSGHSAIIHHNQNAKYLVYYFHSQMFFAQKRKLAYGTKVIEVTPDALVDITLPIPPAEIQCEIVRILDNFTNLTADLTAELTARQKQYAFYRNKLLTFGKTEGARIERIPLGDIGSICMCKRILKSQTSTVGGVPFYKIGTFGKNADSYISQETFDEYRSKYNFPKKGDVLISAAGTIGRIVVYDGEPAYFQDSNIVWIDNDESVVLNSYLRYCYELKPWKVSSGGTIQRLYNDNIAKAVITVPPLDVQSRIVNVLDNFEKICSDLNIGLPAEIEARQKQYEYYRDKLLTFVETGNTILSRAEQSRAEQSRAEQSRAEQSRAEQSTD